MLRRLLVLVAVLMVGHTVIDAGRFVLMSALGRSYGVAGLNEAGEPARWIPRPGADVPVMPDVKPIISLRIPLGRAVPHRPLTEFQKQHPNYSTSGGLGEFRGQAIFYNSTPHTEVMQLTFGRNDRSGGVTSFVPDSKVRFEGVRGAPFIRTPRVAAGGFQGVVCNEYWVLRWDGTVVTRQPLGFDIDSCQTYKLHEYDLLVARLGTSMRPDRIPYILSRFRPDTEPQHAELILEPRTDHQRGYVWGMGLVASLRPFPLLALSTARPECEDPLDLWTAWWLDPLLFGGANEEWIAIGALVAVLCGWAAWRIAGLRCATRRDQCFWAVAVMLTGPLGLVWMRLALPWYAIENGRPVNLGEWPAPARSDREVIAELELAS
ncbi:MAG: hypothetical protein AAGD14_03215 [Planctomycetota bacterium]